MSDADRNSWAAFLTQMTSRPGWSVARLARDAHLHRSTIFRWIKGDAGITLDSVRAVAAALDVPLRTALLAAGDRVGDEVPTEKVRDEAVELILSSDASPVRKKQALEELFRRREVARQRELEDARWLIGEDDQRRRETA